MNLTFLFLILSAFYFVEQSLGKSLSNEIASKVSTSEETSTDNEALKGENLREKVIKKLATLSDGPIKLGIKIIQDAFADKSDNEDVNEFLTRVLSNYQDLSPEKPLRKIEFLFAFSAIFELFSGLGPINDTSEFRNRYIAIQKALEKYDVKAVASECQNKIEEFLNWLTTEIEIRIRQNRLTLEGQRLAQEFKELCLQFKEETDFLEKIRIFTILMRKLKE